MVGSPLLILSRLRHAYSVSGEGAQYAIIGDDKECLYLIEYDGAQHYRAAPMWDDTMSLKERQMRDRMKNKWCSDRGIPLIRIPFTHLNKLSIDDLCLESTRYRIV